MITAAGEVAGETTEKFIRDFIEAFAIFIRREQNLDWAFCDTDSIAIANTSKLLPNEFKAKALLVRDWFQDRNPYEEDRSALQLEKVNFPEGMEGDLDALDPPFCLAVSAKRYVVLNRKDGTPVIRKASWLGALARALRRITRGEAVAHRENRCAALAGRPLERDHPRCRQ